MSLFRKLRGTARPPERPGLPADVLLYAIGDVHGRDDLLAEILAKIEADSAKRQPSQRVIVFLGDLIDRGPSSREVIERLRTLRPAGTRLVFLAGNHEEVLLNILDGDAALIGDWLRFGGAECLKSYGVDPCRLRQLPPEQAIAAVRAAIPEAHVEFLRRFDDSFRAADYLFVHAGIRPGVALGEQSRADLRWIREPFLSDKADHGFTVVHGHTIRKKVDECNNRIGIDTGAYRYGILTAIGLQGEERWFLEAGREGASSEVRPGNPENTSVLDAVSSQSG